MHRFKQKEQDKNGRDNMGKNKFLLLICVLITVWAYKPDEAGAYQEYRKKGTGKSTVMIVMYHSENDRQAIMEQVKQFPGLHIRREYHASIRGFSIEGSRSALLALRKRLKQGNNLYDVTTYRHAAADSVPFIGTDTVRGMYDTKNQRLTGKGVKVGVIDTGIDYNHPDLSRAYKGGRDAIDLDNDPMETKGSSERATLHGTHVAGVIAANGKKMGVAPDVELYAYRALGPGGSGDTESVITAIEMAIKDKMDIINLSLGSPVNAPDLPVAEALNAAVGYGITAVVSSGNSGPDVWSVGSPGTASKAISVGASSPPSHRPYLLAGLGSTRREIPLQQILGAAVWEDRSSFALVDGKDGDGKELRHAKGKIALIQRGKKTLYEKVRQAERYGALGVIIYNNDKGSFVGGTVKNTGIPAVSISREDGLWLKSHIKEALAINTVFRVKQDLIADFSSRGPVTVNWEIKPDVVAPGIDIDSTVPDGYLLLQGTSMAAPHITGAAALLKQAHPDWKPHQIKSAIMTTAKILKNEEGKRYKTYEQGAGRIQIDEAVRADTFLYPSSVTFGLFNRTYNSGEHEQTITIENGSPVTKHYSFTLPPVQSGLDWHLPRKFTLRPKEKKKIVLGLTVHPEELKQGIYDGYLELYENTKRLHIPYLYMNEEPGHPRMMGFHFSGLQQKGVYRYEMYLPSGADELSIALYDYDTFRFAGFLDRAYKVPKGLVEREIRQKASFQKGLYRAAVLLEKDGRRDEFYKYILIR